MLAIEFEQDGVEEALGLAAGGAGGDDHVEAIDMRGPDGAFLMRIQSAIDQCGHETLGTVRETLARQRSRMQSFREPSMGFRKRPLQEASLFPQRFLEGRPQEGFLEEERGLQVVLVALPNSLRPIPYIGIRHRACS